MLTESVALLPEFSSYFSFSKLRSGYSGVATYCRSSATPVQAQSGLTLSDISAGSDQLRLEFSPGLQGRQGGHREELEGFLE